MSKQHVRDMRPVHFHCLQALRKSSLVSTFVQKFCADVQKFCADTFAQLRLGSCSVC